MTDPWQLDKWNALPDRCGIDTTRTPTLSAGVPKPTRRRHGNADMTRHEFQPGEWAVALDWFHSECLPDYDPDRLPEILADLDDLHDVLETVRRDVARQWRSSQSVGASTRVGRRLYTVKRGAKITETDTEALLSALAALEAAEHNGEPPGVYAQQIVMRVAKTFGMFTNKAKGAPLLSELDKLGIARDRYLRTEPGSVYVDKAVFDKVAHVAITDRSATE